MKLILLDRDGVINEDRDNYVKNVNEFKFINNSITAINNFISFGFDVFVFTNQASVSKGLTTIDDVNSIHNHINQQLYPNSIKNFFICYHTDSMNCYCRKPKDGMIKDLFNKYPGYDLTKSFVVGDNIRDLIPAYKNNIKTVLVKTGNGINAIREKNLPKDTLIYNNLYDFSKSEWICIYEK